MAGGDLWFFDRTAPLYDRLMFPADADALERGLALAGHDVERVIDVAGGSGRAIEEIDAPERLLLDASRPMLDRVSHPGIQRLLGDAGRLPLADGSVDAVVIADALHHLPDVDLAISEMARILEPGGVLLIRDFDPGSLRGWVIELLEQVVQFESTFYRPDELTEKLEAAGLTPSVPESGWTYSVVGVKPA